jgi:hypothetical protein
LIITSINLEVVTNDLKSKTNDVSIEFKNICERAYKQIKEYSILSKNFY